MIPFNTVNNCHLAFYEGEPFTPPETFSPRTLHEQKLGNTTPEREISLVLPRGDVMLGETDPTRLTHEEFEHSPELLFHGSKNSFDFSPEYDYDLHEVPNSVAVGMGFYTSPDRNDAILFSRAFGAKEGKEVVTEVLPYKAQMYDFRTDEDASINAPVPKTFLNEYRMHIIDYMKQRFPDGFDTSNMKDLFSYRDLRAYSGTLNRLYFSDKAVDLRQMLSNTGDESASEYGGRFFSDFIQNKGYDGIIYVEGGDHPEHDDPVSIVFYNTKKIGTYDSWHRDLLS